VEASTRRLVAAKDALAAEDAAPPGAPWAALEMRPGLPGAGPPAPDPPASPVAAAPKGGSFRLRRASLAAARQHASPPSPFRAALGPSALVLEVWSATAAAAAALVALGRAEQEAARRSAAMKAVSSAGMHLFAVEGSKAASPPGVEDPGGGGGDDDDGEKSLRSVAPSLKSVVGRVVLSLKSKHQFKNKRLISAGQALWSDNRTVVAQGCASMWTLCRSVASNKKTHTHTHNSRVEV
jgi:hypothetical protein